MNKMLMWIGVVVSSILLVAPQAAAVTTVDLVISVSWIESSTSCDTGLGLQQNHQYSYSHVNLDDVVIPMDEGWDDDRAASSAAFDNVFRIEATYLGTPYSAQHTHTTTGAETDTDDTLELVVPNVLRGTSMSVIYIAYVHRQSDPPGTNLCYDDLPVTYSFTA